MHVKSLFFFKVKYYFFFFEKKYLDRVHILLKKKTQTVIIKNDLIIWQLCTLNYSIFFFKGVRVGDG